MTFALTLLLTFFLVSGALLLFVKFGAPVYRVERSNVVKLLDLVISGEATEADWQVFAAYPIRNDPALGEVQRQCLAVAEGEYLGGQGMLFTHKGIAELKKILDELKALEEE
jgi:hypothetical protein